MQKKLPFGVVSLEDVLAYAADIFCTLTDVIGRIVGQPWMSLGAALSNDGYKQELAARFQSARKLSRHHGWFETEQRINEVEQYLLENPCLPQILQHKCADLENHIFRLFDRNLFFHVNPDSSKEYFKWVEQKNQTNLMRFFPQSFMELSRAANCYLVDEGTASVFHSMRALEIGLNAMAGSLNVAVLDRDQWEVVINKCESAISQINGPHAGADWRKKQEFYSEAALHFRFLKNAWRNHVMHARTEYNSPQALEILTHVTTFVASLSTNLGLKEPLADVLHERMVKIEADKNTADSKV